MTETFVIEYKETAPVGHLMLPVYPVTDAVIVDGYGVTLNPAHCLLDKHLGIVRFSAGGHWTRHPYRVTVTRADHSASP